MCGEVGAHRGAVIAMRMCVMMCCAMAFGWGSSLRALLLRFDCDIPLVFAAGLPAFVLLCAS